MTETTTATGEQHDHVMPTISLRDSVADIGKATKSIHDRLTVAPIGDRTYIVQEEGEYVAHHDITDNLEKSAPWLLRPHGSTIVHCPESLAAAIQVARTNDSNLGPAVYLDCSESEPVVTVVLNEWYEERLGHADWRLTLEIRKTRAGKDWFSRQGEWMSQASFADFLDDHLDDLAGGSRTSRQGPDLSEVIGMIRNFSEARNVSLQRKVHRQSGAISMAYSDDNSTKKVNLPETIQVAIRPWSGRPEAFSLTCDLRYRWNSEELVFSYAIRDLDRVEEEMTTQLSKLVIGNILGALTTEIVENEALSGSGKELAELGVTFIKGTAPGPR